MGCDIHAYAERAEPDGSFTYIDDVDPFPVRSYGVFGFLAGVRNYSAVPPIAERRGFPDNASADVREAYDSWASDGHSASWLTIDELLAFDYDAEMEDRRVTRNYDGGCTCAPGDGEKTTYRQFLGESAFFEPLYEMRNAGATRVVFWFDN